MYFAILILTSDSMTAPNSGLPIKWADFRFWMSLIAGTMGADNWLEVFQGNSSKAPRKAWYNSVFECPRLLSMSLDRSSWTMSPGTAFRGGVQVSQSSGCSNNLTLPRFKVPTSYSLSKENESCIQSYYVSEQHLRWFIRVNDPSFGFGRFVVPQMSSQDLPFLLGFLVPTFSPCVSHRIQKIENCVWLIHFYLTLL